MFHRVRSEVQDTEQKDKTQSSAPDYRSREARKPSSSKRRAEEIAAEEREEQQEEQFELEHEIEGQEDDVAEEQDEAPSMFSSRNSYVDDVEVQGRSADIGTGSFQRPFQPAGRTPGAYPGSYVPPQSHESAPLSAADRTLTIGRGINMSGEIEACDHLVVEGTVEAALKGSKVLEILESGTFYGTVEIEEATIAGRFEGDITVNGRLTISSTGAITGSIAYRELEVESGAVLDGKMTPLKAEASNKRLEKYKAGSDASAMAKAKDIIAKRERREPANVEGGFFTKANAKK